MTFRTAYAPVRAVNMDMGGFVVKQPLPHARINNIDPFLLLHHAGPVSFEGGGRQSTEGVPPHPHRGFEPVTFVFKGGVHHRDSRGNDHVVRAGGVQWMTAGMGIVHSERPARELVEDGGEWELLQLWVNLPARFKMVQPRYQGLSEEDIPVMDQDGFRIQVVAGALDRTAGAALTHTPVTALILHAEEGASTTLALPDGQVGFLYALDGHLTLNEEVEVPGNHMAELDGTGPLRIDADQDTRALLMLGEPIGEPVVSSGPFVMSNTTEILEAMRDSQIGRMGILIEDF